MSREEPAEAHEVTQTEGAGKTVVVALGGNAILQPGQVGTFEEQLVNVDGATRRIAQMVADGYRVVMTHGNGPQVGNLLIQQEVASKLVAPMPMDVCGAMSQGEIGYMLEQTLHNHLRKRKLAVPVVTLLTQVAVDAKDPAFAKPSKPVGPFYDEAKAKTMMLEQAFAMKEDAGRGWRRVVPSPEPIEIVPRDAIIDLLHNGVMVVCSGGGGIPVVRGRNGALSGALDQGKCCSRQALSSTQTSDAPSRPAKTRRAQSHVRNASIVSRRVSARGRLVS